MRIRKHARISSLSPPCSLIPCSSSSSSAPATHVCELSRSPWDVIAFTSKSPWDEYQVKLEDKYMNYIGEEDSVYVFKSAQHCWGDEVVLKRVKREEQDDDLEEEEEEEEKKKCSGLVDYDSEEEEQEEEKRIGVCNKTDGKGWYCKKEAKEGNPLCEHHLIQLKSYNYSDYTHSRGKSSQVKPPVGATTTATIAANKRRNRGRVSSASPSEFYYYSGFGPSWSKKRSKKGNEIKVKDVEMEAVDSDTNAEASSSSMVHVANYHDYDSDDDDQFEEDVCDDSDDDTVRKKRVRKPIKERSLNSLF
ncbi:hypothetical protein IFM89_022726 [Coptis chinensis]|uniref:WRC domain-containing protein n=1 Tax=Coptis chinensis TaxID=261450 RepID=A0A835M1C3_9MAGN|nr:hypothetical protein IFM89_022726 [Coptis chinensis]